MSIIDEIKQSYKQGSDLNKLIYINIGIFLALHIAVILLVLSNQFNRDQSILQVLDYLAVPADLSTLARRPWTIVTYMFTHGQLYHILFNMLVIFWFGRFFIQEFGMTKVLPVYILGGLAGAVFFVLFYNIFPFFEEVRSISIATGASASAMAIVIAAATAAPNKNMHLVLIGPVKILYVALFLFITSTILDFTDNTGGKIAHMGGALLGYLFARSYKTGKDFTISFNRFISSFSGIFKPGRKMKVTHKAKNKRTEKKPADDIEYKKEKASEQKEMDRILDKISKAGYDSLSKAEKEKLFNMKK